MKKRLTRWLAVTTALSLAVALGGCAGDKKGNPKDSITIGIPQDIEETLDPHDMVAQEPMKYSSMFSKDW